MTLATFFSEVSAMAHVPRYLFQRGPSNIYAFASYKTGASTTASDDPIGR